MQIQDIISSDDELDIFPSSKSEMVCNWAQIPPEKWMTLPLEAKKWLLNERKCQQQQDDKVKKHLALNNKGTTKMPDKDNSNPFKIL